MNTKLEAAARQALAVLLGQCLDHPDADDAITALREALAEQAAESDRSGCAAGSDEECTNRHCATKCPALAGQQAAEPAIEVEISPMSTGGTTATVWSHRLPVGTHKLYTHPAPTQQPLTVTGCSYCLNKTAYKLTPTCTECGHDMLTATKLEAAKALIDHQAAQALGKEGGAA